MYCPNNNLVNLPKLNNKLEHLICSNNKLIFLPTFNVNLERIYCGSNIIINLPELNNNLKKSQRDDIASNIATAHDDIKELEESYKKANILKAGEDYISQLSKCLPSSIKDRIYRDSINVSDSETDHDIELEKELRVIGDYTANELKGFKKLYKETGETRGPSSIIRHQRYLDQYIAFLKE